MAAVAEFEVLPQQADLVELETLFAAAYGGVGAGKTLGAQLKMWKRMRRYPKAGHYVVGADFEQLRGGYFPDMRALLEDVFKWREGRDFKYRDLPRPQITFLRSGARLRSLSAKLAERIRSTHIQTLHAEEPQTWPNGEAVWRTLVGRRRHSVRSAREHAEMQIQYWLTFNPKDCPVGSWLYKLVTDTFPSRGYPVIRFSLRDNYLLENHKQYIQDIEDMLPPSLWPIEIDGHFPTLGGGAYREFDASIHATPSAIPPGLPPMGIRPERLYWTLDFNVAFMCSLILQPFVQQPIIEYTGQPRPKVTMPVPGWQQRVWYAVDEICLDDAGSGRGVGIEDVCDQFIKRYGDHCRKHGLTIYGDPAGNGRSQSGSGSDATRTNWEAVRARMLGAGIRDLKFRVQSSHPSIGDRLNMMNRQFRIGSGYGFLIDPLRCPEFITDLMQNKVDPLTGKLDKSDKTESGLRRTHTGDAAGYLIYVERKLEANPKSIEFMMVR